MERVIKFETIKGSYEPSKPDLYLTLDHDGLPELALIAEPVKTYNDEYDGIVFYKRLKNTSEYSAKFSQQGGSTIKTHGYSRSQNI